MIERGSEEKLMHSPGEVFCVRYRRVIGGKVVFEAKIAHINTRTSFGFDPAGEPCEIYRAICGRESQSWAMPSQGIEPADLITADEAQKAGAEFCQACFSNGMTPVL